MRSIFDRYPIPFQRAKTLHLKHKRTFYKRYGHRYLIVRLIFRSESPMDEKELIRRVLDDPILFKLSTLAKEKGVPLFLVGGYLRDLLLRAYPPAFQLPAMDYDFALPKEFSSFISTMENVSPISFL